MSSVHLRDFISERLTAAATEIFSEFEKTILRYEEEIDRQRRLLDSSSWKLKVHRVDLQQEPVHKTQTLKDQQLCKQEKISSVDQEEPEPPQVEDQEKPEPPQFEDQEDLEPPQIKVEEQELCTNQEEDQLHLKQETDPVLVTVLYEESKADSDREQLISQSSAGPEDQDSGSNEKTDHTEDRHGNQAGPSETSERFSCQICGETFVEKSLWNLHIKVHKVRNQNSDYLMYCCPTCGKKVRDYGHLVVHMRIHTGEKPFSCKGCGKRFHKDSHLRSHMRIHTGERPFSCRHCEKKFTSSGDCKRHMRIHTGEKPFICKTCGKCFSQNSNLKSHMKVHRD